MNTVIIIINVLFFITVLVTIIIHRNKFSWTEEVPSSEDEPETSKSLSGIAGWLILEGVSWVMFNIAAIQMRTFLGTDSVLGFFVPVALVVLNIACLGVFIYVLRSIPYMIGVTVLWLLINIFIKYIVIAVLVVIGITIGIVYLSSQSSGERGRTEWFTPIRNKRPPKGQYDPRYQDPSGEPLDDA